MAKVKYIEKGGAGVSVQRWRFLPDGSALTPKGQKADRIPDDVAYSPAAKRLADQGILAIEGYTPATKAPKKVAEAPKKQPEVPTETEKPAKKPAKKPKNT